MNEISPQEFGRLQATVDGLQRDSFRQLQMLERLEEKLESVESQLSEAKGGWKLMMLLGGGPALLASVVTWVATHWGKP